MSNHRLYTLQKCHTSSNENRRRRGRNEKSKEKESKRKKEKETILEKKGSERYQQIKEGPKTHGKHEAWFSGRWIKDKSKEKDLLDQKYGLRRKGFILLIEELKQRITGKATKVKPYDNRIK